MVLQQEECRQKVRLIHIFLVEIVCCPFRYRLVVRRGQGAEGGLQLVEVAAGEEVAQGGQGMGALTLQLASSLASSWRGDGPLEPVSPLGDEPEEEEDNEEPVLSGSGGVSKEVSELELQGWGDVLTSWLPNQPPPKTVAALVKAGVPEALRLLKTLK